MGEVVSGDAVFDADLHGSTISHTGGTESLPWGLAEYESGIFVPGNPSGAEDRGSCPVNSQSLLVWTPARPPVPTLPSPHSARATHVEPKTNMKNLSWTLLGLLAAPLLLSALPTRDTIAFAPEDGTSVTVTFLSTSEMTLDDMQMLMNGEENARMPSIEMDMITTTENQFTDTYERMAKGQPARLKRTYDSIQTAINGETTMEMMGEEQSEDLAGSGTSELEGESVLFNLKDGEYIKSWPEGEEGDDELLENLVEDVSLRRMLPEGDISEGESWDIDLSIMLDLLAPGGDLGLELEMEGGDNAMSMGPDTDMMSDIREMLGGNMDGTITGKLTGYRDVEGARVAVIEIDLEVDCTTDMVDMMREKIEESMPPEAGVEIDLSSVDVSYVMEGDGELLWNASAGHIAGVSLEMEVAMSMEMAMGMDAGGQQMDMEMAMEMSGTTEVTVEVE